MREISPAQVAPQLRLSDNQATSGVTVILTNTVMCDILAQSLDCVIYIGN